MQGLAQHLTFCKYSVLVFLQLDCYGHRNPFPLCTVLPRLRAPLPSPWLSRLQHTMSLQVPSLQHLAHFPNHTVVSDSMDKEIMKRRQIASNTT